MWYHEVSVAPHKIEARDQNFYHFTQYPVHMLVRSNLTYSEKNPCMMKSHLNMDWDKLHFLYFYAMISIASQLTLLLFVIYVFLYILKPLLVSWFYGMRKHEFPNYFYIQNRLLGIEYLYESHTV